MRDDEELFARLAGRFGEDGWIVIPNTLHLETLYASENLRERMVDVVSRVGGHFAPGLGVVELTIALHYVFDTPRDRLVWDVGHQGYPHKILTGRNDRLPTIRTRGGLAPFLRRDESEYDAFGATRATSGISSASG